MFFRKTPCCGLYVAWDAYDENRETLEAALKKLQKRVGAERNSLVTFTFTDYEIRPSNWGDSSKFVKLLKNLGANEMTLDRGGHRNSYKYKMYTFTIPLNETLVKLEE